MHPAWRGYRLSRADSPRGPSPHDRSGRPAAAHGWRATWSPAAVPCPIRTRTGVGDRGPVAGKPHHSTQPAQSASGEETADGAADERGSRRGAPGKRTASTSVSDLGQAGDSVG
eukprot:ctg_1481.g426